MGELCAPEETDFVVKVTTHMLALAVTKGFQAFGDILAKDTKSTENLRLTFNLNELPHFRCGCGIG